MKTKGTKAEIKKIETEAIESFEKEFHILCDKFSIKWICVWTRHETEKFTDDENNSLTAWFVISYFKQIKNKEAAAFLTSYDESSKVASQIAMRWLMEIVHEKWGCVECTAEEKTEEKETKKD